MQNKCCCLPTEKAFLLIVYLDISRIIWGTVTCAFMFQRESSFSLVITILDIILIVLQSSLALYINMRALKQNNKKPIYVYRKFKLLFVFFNTLDRLIAPIINCTLIFKDDQEEAKKNYCVIDIFVALIITAIIWNFIEYYFYTIVKDFVMILQRSDNRSLRITNDKKYKNKDNNNLAIMYEVVGMRPVIKRRGQQIVEADRIEQGNLKTNLEAQRIYAQPIQQSQNFQILGSCSGLIEIDLIQ
ncbi:unnamed protein product [Paramecium sonneborni]|uniref:Uncharacterized protein n=1 Tax=Paramecium sonneborni TaxID=65129 RepID=A0A8S1MYS2_9CILI|nr:unnamed protein product [Paramecium sonneborni]